jgi:hypothetical protein
LTPVLKILTGGDLPTVVKTMWKMMAQEVRAAYLNPLNQVAKKAVTSIRMICADFIEARRDTTLQNKLAIRQHSCPYHFQPKGLWNGRRPYTG